MAEELRCCVGAAAEVVLDPDPDGRLRSPWRTYRACLERGLDLGADSILVLQDDVLVCGYLLEGVDLAATARPGRPLAFFVPGRPMAFVQAIRAASERGEAWAELRLGSWVPVVATLWPAALAAGLLEWFDAQRFPSGLAADDEIVGRFLRAVGVAPLASVPSLVEHPDTVPSVMSGYRRLGDGRDPNRRAFFWIGDDPRYECDARTLDWTSGAA